MEKKYGWNGWKMPILHPDDPDYCEMGCPICVPARKGNKIAKFVQNIESAITSGGCWWGRARKRKYGVTPNQPVSSKQTLTALPDACDTEGPTSAVIWVTPR